MGGGGSLGEPTSFSGLKYSFPFSFWGVAASL